MEATHALKLRIKLRCWRIHGSVTLSACMVSRRARRQRGPACRVEGALPVAAIAGALQPPRHKHCCAVWCLAGFAMTGTELRTAYVTLDRSGALEVTAGE